MTWAPKRKGILRSSHAKVPRDGIGWKLAVLRQGQRLNSQLSASVGN